MKEMNQSQRFPGVSEKEQQELFAWAKKWNVDEKHFATVLEVLSQRHMMDYLKEKMEQWEELCKKQPSRLTDKSARGRHCFMSVMMFARGR